jgi:methyl-accepting chemotaxis protein
VHPSNPINEISIAELSELYKEGGNIDKWSQLGVDVSNEQHLHLISDVRTLLMHIGDTSNLILDPHLDTSYLMQVLIAVSRMQERVQEAMAYAEGILRRGLVTDLARRGRGLASSYRRSPARRRGSDSD